MTNRFSVIVALALLALAGGIARAEEPSRGATPLAAATGSARGSGLVGKHVAVDVGAVVDLPSETAEPHRPALRDVAIAGAQFTELSVTGQETPLLVPAPRSRFEGSVTAIDGDVLTIRLFGHSQVVTVPRAAITSLQVRQSHTHAGKGALIGAGVGLAAGVGLIVAIESGSCGGEDRAFCSFLDAAATVTSTAGGALVGAVAGAMTHTDRWERVDPRRLSVTVMPDPRGGVRGRLAVRF
jgi:hypothetical protein